MTQKHFLEELYADTFTFNDLAGNTNKLSLTDIKNQIKLIVEETTELKDAADVNDPVEVLDAVVDLYFVLNGLTSKLISLGFDVPKACKQTSDNNLSKFPVSEQVAINSIPFYKEKGVDPRYEFNESHQRYIIKDHNNKVKKPLGYVENDLSNCVPEGFDKF